MTFRRGGIDEWGAALVEALRDPMEADVALAGCSDRDGARELLERMIGERLVVEERAAPETRAYRVEVKGANALADALSRGFPRRARDRSCRSSRRTRSTTRRRSPTRARRRPTRPRGCG